MIHFKINHFEKRSLRKIRHFEIDHFENGLLRKIAQVKKGHFGKWVNSENKVIPEIKKFLSRSSFDDKN